MVFPKNTTTPIGLAVIGLSLVLQLFGVGHCSPEEVQAAAQACVNPDMLQRLAEASAELVTVGGALIVAYGKRRAMRREKELEDDKAKALALAAAAARK